MGKGFLNAHHNLTNSKLMIVLVKQECEMQFSSTFILVCLGRKIQTTLLYILGYYIFYETSGGSTNATATVQKNFTANGLESCLQFWYHMYGRSVNTLNVYSIQGGNQLAIWSRSFNQGNTWYKAETTVNITQGDYTVSSVIYTSRCVCDYKGNSQGS